MDLVDLDVITRPYVRAEIEADIAQDNVYVSRRLSDGGRSDYLGLLLTAADGGTTETFAIALASENRLKEKEQSHSRNGKPFEKDVPFDAHQTMAEGELNRYYVRGLCARVVEGGGGQVEVYRAKAVESPRPESEAMIGKQFDAATLLADLRDHPGVESALGLARPNSGLSVRLLHS